jgi:Lrp/AsnC family transcriptional regulator for asnA, asnC and gidA
MGREEKQPAYPRDLDTVDRQILRLLRDDGRRPNAEIARALGVSEPTVRKRLDRLRESGVLKIIGVLDPSATGFPVYAMIGLRVAAGRGREIGQRLTGMDCVANVTFITGRWDIWIEVMLPSNMRLHEFLGDDLTDIGGIVSSETFLVLAIEKFNYTWDLPDPDAPPTTSPTGVSPAAGEPHEDAAPAGATPRRAETVRKLDAMDRQILRLLQDDGRRPNADIARALGVSEPTVRKRLDRLLESGVLHIIGLLDPAATGFPVDVFVGIKAYHGHARDVGQNLAGMGCVTFVGYTTGPFDLLIEAVFADNAALLTFLSESVGSAPGVISTETIHILRVDKFKYMWDLPEASGTPDAGGRGATALTSWTQGHHRGSPS